MANCVDLDQTAPSLHCLHMPYAIPGSALFAYAILSDTLVYEILGHLS